MTNIMAVTVRYGEDGDAVYICSDSQSSSVKEKGRIQKLFLRGGNFITSTGKSQRMWQTIDGLDEVKEIVKPSYVADRIFEGGKKFTFRKTRKGEPEDAQGYIVVGIEDEKPVIYSVHLCRESYGSESGSKKSIQKAPSCFKGSGSSQTLPAISRDYETGNLGLADLAEGLALCFSLGDKAGDDIYVDDKLQIGLMANGFTRMLIHPVPGFRGKEDYLNFLNTNTGLNLTEKDISRDYIGLGGILGVFNDLYHDMMVGSARMCMEDIAVNGLNTWSKVDAKNRKKHEEKRRQALKRRDAEKAKLSGLIDSWVSGDIAKVADGLKQYNRGREEMHSAGVDFAMKKKGVGNAK